MLTPEHLTSWVMFCPKSDISGVPSFISNLKSMGAQLGVDVAAPMEM